MYDENSTHLCLSDANFISDLRQRFQNGEFTQDDLNLLDRNTDSNCVNASNRTGDTVTSRCVVGLGCLINGVTPKNPSGAFTNPVIAAEAYDKDTHGCRVGVVQIGAPNKCSIKLQVCGPVVLSVRIEDEDHCFAKPDPSDSKCLISDVTGCFEILSKSKEPLGDKTICLLKFAGKSSDEDEPCDCGLPPGTYCGVLDSIANGQAVITYQQQDGDEITLTVPIKGGGLPTVGTDVVFHVSPDCECFMVCKENQCLFPELFLCYDEDLYEILGSAVNGDGTITHTVAILCETVPAFGVEIEITLSCDEEQCIDPPILIEFPVTDPADIADCPPFELTGGNHGGCCCPFCGPAEDVLSDSVAQSYTHPSVPLTPASAGSSVSFATTDIAGVSIDPCHVDSTNYSGSASISLDNDQEVVSFGDPAFGTNFLLPRNRNATARIGIDIYDSLNPNNNKQEDICFFSINHTGPGSGHNQGQLSVSNETGSTILVPNSTTFVPSVFTTLTMDVDLISFLITMTSPGTYQVNATFNWEWTGYINGFDPFDVDPFNVPKATLETFSGTHTCNVSGEIDGCCAFRLTSGTDITHHQFNLAGDAEFDYSAVTGSVNLNIAVQ